MAVSNVALSTDLPAEPQPCGACGPRNPVSVLGSGSVLAGSPSTPHHTSLNRPRAPTHSLLQPLTLVPMEDRRGGRGRGGKRNNRRGGACAWCAGVVASVCGRWRAMGRSLGAGLAGGVARHPPLHSFTCGCGPPARLWPPPRLALRFEAPKAGDPVLAHDSCDCSCRVLPHLFVLCCSVLYCTVLCV